MSYTLPALKFNFDALEPYIDTKTMEIHHGKHHQAYINNLNAALEGEEDLQNMPIEDLLMHFSVVPQEKYWTVRNNAGGHYNHTLFWEALKPADSQDPKLDMGADLLKQIESDFESFENFQATFKKAALGQFGSGWAWLVLTPGGKLSVVSTPNQDNPLVDGHKPLLGLDVWEHAYYLNYQNRRLDYIDAWWSVVDWRVVEARYQKARY